MKIVRLQGIAGKISDIIGLNIYEAGSIRDYLDNKDKIFHQSKFPWKYLVRERAALDIKGQIFYQYKGGDKAQLSDKDGSILEVRVSNLTKSDLEDNEELCRVGFLVKPKALELPFMHQYIKQI